MFEQGKAVVLLTVTPFEFDASAPPDAYDPINLQLLNKLLLHCRLIHLHMQLCF